VIDPYRAGDSPIHSLDARVKFPLTLAFILTCSLIPHGTWVVIPLLLSISLSAAISSHLGIGYVLKRSMWTLPFVLAAFPLIFTFAGTSLGSIKILYWELIISLDGLERFVSIVVKSWLSVQVAIILVSTTPFPQILHALRWMKVPKLLVAVIGLMWRYIFVLVGEANRLLRARDARSGKVAGYPTGGMVAWRARVAGGMAGNLFLRSLERSDRVYAAMLSRGYDGEVRLLAVPPLRGDQLFQLFSGTGLFLLIIIFGFLLGGAS